MTIIQKSTRRKRNKMINNRFRWMCQRSNKSKQLIFRKYRLELLHHSRRGTRRSNYILPLVRFQKQYDKVSSKQPILKKISPKEEQVRVQSMSKRSNFLSLSISNAKVPCQSRIDKRKPEATAPLARLKDKARRMVNKHWEFPIDHCKRRPSAAVSSCQLFNRECQSGEAQEEHIKRGTKQLGKLFDPGIEQNFAFTKERKPCHLIADEEISDSCEFREWKIKTKSWLRLSANVSNKFLQAFSSRIGPKSIRGITSFLQPEKVDRLVKDNRSASPLKTTSHV
ncbi:uncharacterized protein PGTG_13555 [Puccinia graminis f. sp. tritici CRL 75-36-700-3]|uniref:Uncharacterized protein n=1 Tax=Puccinia graminis f. sp. tritici (strain CRL 75-36-700-3 / race SCCL) TaxID=418459 RepID=E3KTU5_PUCGT|nr:uncharacterized protein PGTG_13555 [Puccinia graminis f. sp. tritici CRL 75-36-700-3]EFP87769.1 hypothetical protein PGTG_13555 [Puccinia graminis f. sp. tritici CRL 75-36-700-3]